MTVEKNSPISWLQVASVAIGTAVGSGILTLSRVCYEKAGPASILSVFFAGLVALIGGLVLTKLGLLCPNKTFFAIIDKLLGKFLGFFLKGYYLLYFIFITAVALRFFTEVISESLIFNNPKIVVASLMLIAGGYLASLDMQVLGRLNQLITPLILITATLPLLFSLIQNGEPLFLLPIFPFKLKNFLEASLAAGFSFTGFEIFIFLLAYMQKPTEGYKVHISSIIIITFVYFIVVIVGIGIMGENVLSRQWPTLDVIRYIDVPVAIFERLDGLFIAIWVLAIYTTVANLYCISVKYSGHLLQIENYRYFVLPIGLLILFLTLVPRSLRVVSELADWVGIMGVVGVTIIPVGLYLISFVKGIKKCEEQSY